MDALAKVAALLFFFLFFCGVVAWTFWSARSRAFPRDAALPLDDDSRVAPEDLRPNR